MDLRRDRGLAAGRRHPADDRVPRLRQHRSHAGGLPPGGRTPHPQHRPPPRQHSLRHREPGGARGLLHRRDRPAPGQGARRGGDAPDRRRPLHRARDRYRQVHVREHLSRGPSHGGRADRDRGRAPPGAPPPLRGSALPAPATAPASAVERRALRRRRADDRPSRQGRLRGERRPGAGLRRRGRPHARRGGNSGGGARARVARR